MIILLSIVNCQLKNTVHGIPVINMIRVFFVHVTSDKSFSCCPCYMFHQHIKTWFSHGMTIPVHGAMADRWPIVQVRQDSLVCLVKIPEAILAWLCVISLLLFCPALSAKMNNYLLSLAHISDHNTTLYVIVSSSSLIEAMIKKASLWNVQAVLGHFLHNWSQADYHTH